MLALTRQQEGSDRSSGQREPRCWRAGGRPTHRARRSSVRGAAADGAACVTHLDSGEGCDEGLGGSRPQNAGFRDGDRSPAGRHGSFSVRGPHAPTDPAPGMLSGPLQRLSVIRVHVCGLGASTRFLTWFVFASVRRGSQLSWAKVGEGRARCQRPHLGARPPRPPVSSHPQDKEPRGIIPLENLSIREVEDSKKPVSVFGEIFG